jgi:hypothetical protein
VTDKKIGAIKIDFLNSRVEMSPNMKILKKEAQSITDSGENEEVVLFFEINTNDMSQKEYQAYSLFKDEVEDDEPFDLNKPWYKDESVPIPASTGAGIKKAEPTPAKEMSSPKSEKTSPGLQKLQAKLTQLKNMIAKLDQQFKEGKIEQDAFLKKKNFLAQKMGTLMGQIEQLKE